MLRQARTLLVLLFSATMTVVGIAQAPAAPAVTKKHASHKKVVKKVEAPVPAPPPPRPKSPIELPAVPPTVTYSGGMLTIDAPNSSLSDVLNAVRKSTGASVEGGGPDRVVVHLGPGRPRDVIAELLQGSRFDFIILGPKDDPGGVQKLMLMARAGSAPAVVGAAPAPQPASAAGPGQGEDGSADEEQDVGEQEEPSPKQVPGGMPEQQAQPNQQPEPQQEQQPPMGQPPAAQQQPGQQQQPDQQQQNQNNPQVKTPEQLLKELQQMQQQRQQQQQQQQQQAPPR